MTSPIPYISRLPFDHVHNYDLTVAGREARGLLRTDLRLGDGDLLHIFNVHLGTSFFERRQQVKKLLDREVLNHGDLGSACVVLGDFNEWTRGLASRLLEARFSVADPKRHLKRGRTYPGVFPFLHLDHIYFDQKLRLENLHLHRSRLSLVASDHLPLAADFRVSGSVTI